MYHYLLSKTTLISKFISELTGNTQVNRKENFNPKDLLKPDNMLRLYASGAFPMADAESGNINWYLPEIRTIIPLDNYNIPRSAKKAMDDESFEIKFDTDFDSGKDISDLHAPWP